MSGLVVTTTDAISSVGVDIQTTSASIRAGLVRVQPFEGYVTGTADLHFPDYAQVHAAPLVTAGYAGNARLAIMIRHLVGSVVRALDARTRELRVYLYFSLPQPHRTRLGSRVKSPDPSPDALQLEDRIDREPLDDEIYADLVEQVRSLGWKPSPTCRLVTTLGSPGVAECIATAAADLEREPATLAVVVCADSFISEGDVSWWSATRRLLGPTNPVGSRPGEAAAVVGLMRHETAQRLGIVPQARVSQVVKTDDASPFLRAAMSDGKALATVMQSLLRPNAQSGRAWVVTDHNGEEYRAKELGRALHVLKGLAPEADVSTVWLPATSIGHVGAAYGGVSIGLIAQAFKRGYAPLPHAMILSSSDSKRRAGILLESL